MQKLAAVALMLLFAFPARAQSVPAGPYAGGSLGMSVGASIGALFGLQGGYKWRNGWRGEFEYRYVNEDYVLNFDDRVSHNFLANAWYDLDVGNGFAPYIGGGIGFAHVIRRDIFVSGNVHENVFAGQFGIGLQYAVVDGFVLDLGYRMLGQAKRRDTLTHGLLFGAKYHF